MIGVNRSIFAINGQFPGPLIRVNEGDRVLINVTNELSDPTTMHWHGLYQNGTNWMVSGVLGEHLFSNFFSIDHNDIRHIQYLKNQLESLAIHCGHQGVALTFLRMAQLPSLR